MILHSKYFPVHGSGSQDPLIWILFRVDPPFFILIYTS